MSDGNCALCHTARGLSGMEGDGPRLAGPPRLTPPLPCLPLPRPGQPLPLRVSPRFVADCVRANARLDRAPTTRAGGRGGTGPALAVADVLHRPVPDATGIPAMRALVCSTLGRGEERGGVQTGCRGYSRAQQPRRGRGACARSQRGSSEKRLGDSHRPPRRGGGPPRNDREGEACPWRPPGHKVPRMEPSWHSDNTGLGEWRGVGPT